MSLRTIFKTAAYCSPTLAGLPAFFIAGGASASMAAFMGGAAVFSGLLLYRAKLDEFKGHKTDVMPRDVQARFSRLCGKFSLKAEIGLLVEGPEKSLRNARAHGDRDNVVVGKELRGRLTPEEMDFVMAHELAHLKHPEKNLRAITDNLPAFNFMFVIPAAISFIVPGNQHYMTGLSAIAGAAFSQLLLSMHLARRHEYDCDKKAVEVTGDVRTAVEAMDKIESLSSRTIDTLNIWIDHPPMRRRKAALAQAFIPDVEAFLEQEMKRYETADGGPSGGFHMDPFNHMP